MSWFVLLTIAFGLSTDAFAISVAKGAASRSLGGFRAFSCGAAFGVVAMLCFWCGRLAMTWLPTDSASVLQQCAAVAMVVIGMQLTVSAVLLAPSSRSTVEGASSLVGFRMVCLMLTANADVAAVSAVLPLGPDKLISGSMIVGATTAVSSASGFVLGARAKQLAGQPAQLISGAVLTMAGCCGFAG